MLDDLSFFLEGVGRSVATTLIFQTQERADFYAFIAKSLEKNNTLLASMLNIKQLGGNMGVVAVRCEKELSSGESLGTALIRSGYIPISEARAIEFAEAKSTDVLIDTLESFSETSKLHTLFSDVLLPNAFYLVLLSGLILGCYFGSDSIAGLGERMPAFLDSPIAKLSFWLRDFGQIFLVGFILAAVFVYYLRNHTASSLRSFLGPFGVDYRVYVAIRFCRAGLMVFPSGLTQEQFLAYCAESIPGGYAKKMFNKAQSRLANQEAFSECIYDTVLPAVAGNIFKAQGGDESEKSRLDALDYINAFYSKRNEIFYSRAKSMLNLLLLASVGGIILLGVLSMLNSAGVQR
jgi:hypothetical protein